MEAKDERDLAKILHEQGYVLITAARKEKGAGLRPFIRPHHPLVWAVDIHDPYLVAFTAAPVRLKNKPAAVPAKVGLAVVSVKGKLCDVFHMIVDKIRFAFF